MSAHPVSAWPSAKIRPPRPHALVSRPRLLNPLHEAVAHGCVILVVAPGGTGKTATLADWAHRSHIPVAWYALDPADRDARRLCDGLCRAVEQALPGTPAGAQTALNAGAAEPDVVSLLLGALEGKPLALVLDDVHHLEDSPEALALLEQALRFRPLTLSLILISRSVPLLGFVTLAALDVVTGVGREDLAFDAVETAALLTAHGIDAANATELAHHSGGWAAGTLLLARAAPGGVRFLRAHADVLLEHMGLEILSALPADLRAFLLESAVLGPITPDAADDILARRDSALRYADIMARGLFMEREAGVFRYHDLFAEFLEAQLRVQDPTRLQSIRRAAAAWWSAHDDLPRALGLLAVGEDWEELAATLDRERITLWSRGLGGTVLLHVERLPLAYHTPRLLALCGYIRSQRGEHAAALALADAGMARATTDEEWLNPATLRVQALAYAGRDADTVRSADAALAVADTIGQDAAALRLRELRGITRLRMGDLDAGGADLDAILSIYRAAGDDDGVARTHFNLATQLIGAGHARDADRHLVQADTRYRRLKNTVVRGELHNSHALYHLLVGNPEAARREAAQACKAAEDDGNPLLRNEALVTLAEACLAAGDTATAAVHADTAATMAERADHDDVLATALRARIGVALARRDRGGTRRLIEEARPLVSARADDALLDLLDGALAIRARAHRRANDLLEAAATRLNELNRPHEAARAHLYRAEALLALGAVRRAEEALNHMATLILPLGCEGYLRPVARVAREVMRNRHVLRHLRRDARLLLDRLAPEAPLLSLVPAVAVEPPLPLLQLSPFGAGRIRLGDRDIALSSVRDKACELLFFAGRAGQPLTRDVLLDALWEGDTAGGSALWNASRDLRRVLGERNWGRSGGAYTLRVPVTDDSRLFNDAARTALGSGAAEERRDAAERALNLIGDGGYLEWCESLWALAERHNVGRQAVTIAIALADLYTREGRVQDAIDICRRAVVFDEFDEAPRVALLRYLALTGQVGLARQEDRAYRQLLREELQVEPSADFIAVVGALGRRSRA